MGKYIKQTIRVLFSIFLIISSVTFLNYATKTKVKFFNKIDLINKVIMKPKINNISDLFPQREKRAGIERFIVIHHEAVQNSSGVMAVNQYHQVANNWRSIAYHFYITKAGKIYQCLDIDKKNASELNHNNESISICIQGNFDIEKPSRKQYLQLLKLCKKLELKYPTAEILGHNSFAKKTCPGKNIDIEKIKTELENLHFLKFLKNEK